MPFILLPQIKCVLLPLMGAASQLLLGSWVYAITAAVPLLALSYPPKKEDGFLFKLSNEKNALRRYVWLKRFIYLSLAGTLGPLLSQWQLLLMLLAGNGLGLVKKVKDPTLHMVCGKIIWLVGALIGIPLVSAALMGFGIATTFKALSKLGGYLNPLCAFLKKRPCPRAKGVMEGIGCGIDLLLSLPFVLLVPAAILLPLSLAAAIIAALRFPLSESHLNRLCTYEQTHSAALERQLAPFVYLKRKRRHLIWVVRFFVRLFCPGKLIGAENLPPPDRTGVIYLCNHGYAAATIFSRAWLNTRFRSWSISDLMDPRDAYDHVMRYQVGQWAFIPAKFKDRATKIVMRIFVWLFDSIDSIPVYRHRLRELMNTFKATEDALECGDIVMIYPENPDDPSLPEPGYVSDRIIPFFSGFTMIGSMFYDKTGCAVTYMPMYCSTGKRCMCISEPIIFNPENDMASEKERIVSLAYNSMAAMRAETEDEK